MLRSIEQQDPPAALFDIGGGSSAYSAEPPVGPSFGPSEQPLGNEVATPVPQSPKLSLA